MEVSRRQFLFTFGIYINSVFKAFDNVLYTIKVVVVILL